MDLSLSEIETLKGISRCQISRYAKDGRLQRTRQGHYSAASLANLAPAFDRYACRGNFIEERAVFLVRAEHAFQRDLMAVVQARRQAAGKWGPVDLTPDQQHQIDTAVKAYVSILSTRSE
jgi:transcriptional regulator with XRE-family HTH domain